MIIQKKNLNKTLFIDIETVSKTRTFEGLSSTMQALWQKKCRQFIQNSSTEITDSIAAELYIQKAGIYAEFAKVVCIAVGYLSRNSKNSTELKLKSFSGDEREILTEFSSLLNLYYDDPKHHFLCGHNIKEFDVPFLCRRYLINAMSLPRLMNIAGKKPWQVKYLLDTMDLWRFGDYKNYTSLDLLAGALGIPSPKDDIDGSRVGSIFWEENDINRIISYCEKDVITVVQVMMKLSGMELIKETNIEISS